MHQYDEPVFPFLPCLDCPGKASDEISWREDIGLRMTDVERRLKELSERPAPPLSLGT